jgi:hypothetical protein
MDVSITDLPSRDLAAGWVAGDACTLPAVEQPLRMAEFDRLFATSLREVRRPAGHPAHARLILAGDATLLGRVQRLVDAEASCCSFFAFTVTPVEPLTTDPAEEAVALDIKVPTERSGVLDALVVRAETSRGTAS